MISHLPEYGLTRADERLLRRHASEIVDRLQPPVAVAELGSGSGKKTRWLLEALGKATHVFYPVEISRSALAMCERELRDIDSISIVGFEHEYLDGLRQVATAYRKPGQQLFVLFLGSTIGNFEGLAGLKFLREVRRILEAGDALLLGTDLEKPSSQLLAAYDDELGVTAAFNLNLLARINRELDGNFDLNKFSHVATINHEARRVEMHLRSEQKQTVDIAAAGFEVEFQKGETIWTESSHKYSTEEIFQMARTAGFRCQAQWIDEEWPFAESLLVAE